MPPRSAVHDLPEELKAELDRRLVAGGFQGYVALAEWLDEQGFGISKSALHRYGQAFEERTAKLRTATRMGVTLAEAVGDDAGALNDALIRMAQGELFDLFVSAEEGGKTLQEALPEITLAVARLTRASVQQKKWAAEYREKAAAAAEDVAKVARKGGLSDQAVEEIRERILGVAG